MLLDGVYWRGAIAAHKPQPDDALIRRRLAAYRSAGITYLRDGGDRFGVCLRARELAAEYGIAYCTPAFPICKKGRYGGFIGRSWETFADYQALLAQARAAGADFIKLMVSGLMDFSAFGVLTEEPLTGEEMRCLVAAAHDQGFAVMAHANGARTVEAAAEAGVDSVEHGAYLDESALQAMAENGTVWVPTLSTIGNLRGKGRFDEGAVAAILDSALENTARFAAMGGLLAPGTDAGAWAVPHGSVTEYALLEQALGENGESVLARGTAEIRRKF